MKTAEVKIAMQHHQLTSNNLFTVGRAGKKRLVESSWKGSYTNELRDKVSYSIEAEGTRTMNATDQDVFLHLLYLHRISERRTLVEDDKMELKTEGSASLGAHLEVDVSGYQLLRMLGWADGGKSYKRLLASLERIGRVYLVCHYEDGKVKKRWSSHLLYHNYELNKQSKAENIKISMCPIFALAAHKQDASLHSSHCLWERSSLSNHAKILHAAICSRLRPGKSQRFKTESLIEYLYGVPNDDRRIRLVSKKVIKELAELFDWEITYQKDSDNWLIRRPKLNLDL